MRQLSQVQMVRGTLTSLIQTGEGFLLPFGPGATYLVLSCLALVLSCPVMASAGNSNSKRDSNNKDNISKNKMALLSSRMSCVQNGRCDTRALVRAPEQGDEKDALPPHPHLHKLKSETTNPSSNGKRNSHQSDSDW